MNSILAVLFIAQAALSWGGQMEPMAPGVRAQGSVLIVRSGDPASKFDTLFFGDDFAVSSGVVLDLQICGFIGSVPTEACVSLGELRKLQGPQKFPIRRRYGFVEYSRVRIVDIDLAMDHAQALLSAQPH